MNFPVFFFLLISSLMPLWSEKIIGMFSSLNLLRLVLWPNGLFLEIVHVHLRRTCTLPLLDRMFFIYLLDSFGLWHSNKQFPY